MKKRFKRVFAVVLTAVMILTAVPMSGFVGLNFDWLDFSTKSSALASSGQCGANVYWSFDESTGTLTISGTGEMPDYGGIDVYTSDDFYEIYIDSPFENNKDIKNVIIEEGITYLGNETFYGCSEMESITIPSSLISVGTYYGAGNTSPFAGCSSLEKVNISSIESWCRIGFYYYDHNPLFFAENLYINGDLITDLTIPASVASIYQWAFYGCKGLATVTVPDGILSVGNKAFSFVNCVIYHGSLSSAPWGAKTMNGYYEYPFFYSDSSKKILNACLYTFQGDLIIPDHVNVINSYAFSDCTELTGITIPDSITYIDRHTFSGCTGLTSVTIPDSVYLIDEYAFSDCEGLKSIELPNTVTELKSYAFLHCLSLKNINIPKGLSVINAYTFLFCESLKELVMPDNIVFIGEGLLGNIQKIYIYNKNCELHFPTPSKSIIIYGFAGSTAQEYAESRGVNFADINTVYHEHDFERLEQTATCSQIGRVYDKCWICGKEISISEQPLLPHTLSGERFEHASSCIRAGYVYDVCSVCGDEVLISELPLAPHTLTGETVEYESTCYQTGCVYDKCSMCGQDILVSVLPLVPHTYERFEQPATCLSIGRVYDVCSVCGDEITVSETPKLPHTYSKTVTLEPTCRSSGRTYDVCAVCGKQYNVTVLPKLDHNFTHFKQEATCTDAGLEYDHCTMCDLKFNEVVFPAAGHRFTHIIQDSDCVNPGEEYDICSVCNQKLNVIVIPTKEHILTHVSIAKTCTVDGEEYDVCSVCNGVFNHTVNKTTGHTFKSITVIPTCTQIGMRFDYCLVCGEQENLEYLPAAHMWGEWRETGSSGDTLTLAHTCSKCSAEETKTVSNVFTGCKVTDGRLTGLTPGMTPESFRNTFITDPSVEFSDDQLNDKIGTGYVLTVYYDEDTAVDFECVIFGDVDGDGIYDGQDAMLVNCLANGLLTREQVGEAKYLAADCNHDGEVNASDALILEQAGLLLSQVDQSNEDYAETDAFAEYLNLIDQNPQPQEIPVSFIAKIVEIIKTIVSFIRSLIVR